MSTSQDLATKHAELLKIVDDLVDPDPCELDHHGGCQTRAVGFMQRYRGRPIATDALREHGTAVQAGAPDVKSRRWLVAIHEAGHAVAARSLDWRVRDVAIIGEGGLTRDAPPWLRSDPRSDRENMLIHLCGPVTDEVLLHTVIPVNGDYGDPETAEKTLAAAKVDYGCGTDMARARAIAARLELSWPAALGEARQLVKTRWAEIERVAVVLHERTKITGSQVGAAVAAR